MTGMRQISMLHSIDAAHRVVGHEGKCARLHGHTYNFVVDVIASGLRYPDFVIDFAVIKDVLNEWDHRTLLWVEDPMTVLYPVEHPEIIVPGKEPEPPDLGIVRLGLNPTSENLAMIAAEGIFRVGQQFNPQIEEVTVTCSETPKSSSRYTWR